MTKKTKTKTKTSAKSSAKSSANDRIDPRMELLARVAGNVAAGVVQSPSPSISTAEKIATIAVDIADQILRKVGVTSPAGSETSEPSPVDIPSEAAS